MFYLFFSFRARQDEMKQMEMEKKKLDKLRKMREKQVQTKIQEKINYDPDEINKNISRKARELRYR